MDLSDRKKIILGTIIKNYIRTGEPIGSKTLIELSGLNVSSATLRNEMSDLCELGFLEQPHTSAGRVPTSAGYDFYFARLMNRRDVTPDLRVIIDKLLNDAAKDPENLASIAGEMLSDLTGYPTIMATVIRDETYIKRVEILPMGRKTVLILLITSDGLAKSRICRSTFGLSVEVLNFFDRLCAANVIGTEVARFTPAFLQSLVAKCGGFSLFLTPLLSSIFEMVEELQAKTINVKGESNLMKCYRNDREARAILSLFAEQERIFSLLASTKDSIEIIYGDKTGIEELKPSNIIVAKYSLGGQNVGRIGILGPTRMAYEQIIPSVEYFAWKLGTVMTQAINDLAE